METYHCKNCEQYFFTGRCVIEKISCSNVNLLLVNIPKKGRKNLFQVSRKYEVIKCKTCIKPVGILCCSEHQEQSLFVFYEFRTMRYGAHALPSLFNKPKDEDLNGFKLLQIAGYRICGECTSCQKMADKCTCAAEETYAVYDAENDEWYDRKYSD